MQSPWLGKQYTLTSIVNTNRKKFSGAVKDPTFETTRNFPLTINDDEVTQRLEETFAEHFGTDENSYTSSALKLGGSEDFGILGEYKLTCSSLMICMCVS